MFKINSENLCSWQNNYTQNDQLVENIVTQNPLKNLVRDRSVAKSHNHLFSNTIKPRLPITSQKASGRCWIFAALNVARREMVEKYNLKDFEFSQTYLFFWDKLERFNYNLGVIIENKDLEVDDRLIKHVVNDPLCDGGQWDMIVNIVEKYGLVPKSCYGETRHSENSRELNEVLKKKFRKAAYEIRNSSDVTTDRKKVIGEVYKLLCKFLGTPPARVKWEYVDKDDKYHLIGSDNPLDFYRDHVNFDFKDYICVVHDPRNSYNNLYSVKYLGNVVEGNPVLYLNLEIEEIKKLISKGIDENKAVWFGCDVGQHLDRDRCAMDIDLVDYSQVLDTSFALDKRERLLAGESLMTHAMCITGFNKENNKINKWQVENSWGKSDAAEGYYIMTDKWFDEYVYEIAVNKKHLSEEQLNILAKGEIEELPPWDPMGSLAH